MDIRAALVKEHSKAQTVQIVEYIGDDSERFEVLLDIFLHDDELRIVQRAAWPISYIGEKYPNLILPYTEKLFSLLDKKVHDAVKRNILRAYRHLDFPEKYDEIIVDHCFQIILRKEAIAIKAFAMDILGRVCKRYPDLEAELALIIKENYAHESIAFKYVGKKILKNLK
jgi:hypothetical protein